jgi:hypothetical protein
LLGLPTSVGIDDGSRLGSIRLGNVLGISFSGRLGFELWDFLGEASVGSLLGCADGIEEEE